MTDQQISAYINVLRCTNNITPLQKDILDTWDELHKRPFDTKTAREQVASNNANYPDIIVALKVMPGIITKTIASSTKEDVVFTLERQFEGLVAKEMMAQMSGNNYCG